MTGLAQCSDFMQFQKALKMSRVIDDKIIYALNTSIPTASIREKHHIDSGEKCTALQQELFDAYETRDNAIKKCINFVAEEVSEAKEKNDGTLRGKQGTLRLLRSELSVEEIIRQRSLTIFKEKCHNYL